MSPRTTSASLALAALLAASCKVGPDYHAPETSAPESFGELAGVDPNAPSTPTAEAVLANWWTTLGDPTLDSLIERAVSANPDLRHAAARVREARAARGIAASALYPGVDASASATRTRFSDNAVGPVSGFTTDLYQAGFDAVWELDLFGGTRRGVEAAEAEVAAAIEDRRDVLVTLLAEVARNYVELRGSQRQGAIARANLAAQAETLELTRTRADAGLANDLDVARAQAQVSTTGARVPELESRALQSLHALGVLLGAAPTALAEELAGDPTTGAPIPAAPEFVPIGLPSDLLRRRPDVRRAERELAAATARIGEAKADLFPSFSITAALGLEAAEVNDFFDAASKTRSLGAGAFLPILDWGRIRDNIDVQNAREEQALANYEAAVLVSLREVEDALVSFTREQRRRAQLVAAVEANRRAADLADLLWREGRTDFLAVLQAERDLFLTEDTLVDSEQRVASDLVALYKALGGGWEIEQENDGGPGGGEPGRRVVELQGAPTPPAAD